jgi:hypothetical protein
VESPACAGSWQPENKALLSASYDLDLWGKNRETLKAAVSQLQASRADEEVVTGSGRGLKIARPALGVRDEVRLPDKLPADLVSRRAVSCPPAGASMR